MDDVKAAPNAYHRATETVQYVRSQLPECLQSPKVAIVCGSGLGGLADAIETDPKVELAYESIPNFPKSTGELGTMALQRAELCGRKLYHVRSAC
jgi:purine-nucleoside phosphorylase